VARSVAQERSGGPGISTQVTVPHPVDAVWALLGDLPAVVRCLPGAELVASEGNTFKANIRVGLGPITASIAGNGRYDRSESDRVGTIVGSGKDKISRSEVSGTLKYSLVSQADSTRIDVDLAYQLKGMLAQFARGSLVEELAVHLLRQFAENLTAVLRSGTDAKLATGKTLTLTGSFWQVIAARLKKRFGLAPKRNDGP
jgi:carbon-monoxide dehydrogenase small subunit